MEKTQNTKLTSAGELNEYMRVTSVPVWIIIAAIGAFMAGLIIWSIGGRLTSSVTGAATVEDGVLSLYIREADAEAITSGVTAVIDDSEFPVEGSFSQSVPASSVMDKHTRLLLGVKGTEPVCISESVTDLPDGNYSASVIIEQLRPISFLFGRKR